MSVATAKEALDEQTRLALEDGLKSADENPRRWTPEEVRADAQRIAKEWQKKISPAVTE
jgi:hypothetical protein